MQTPSTNLSEEPLFFHRRQNNRTISMLPAVGGDLFPVCRPQTGLIHNDSDFDNLRSEREKEEICMSCKNFSIRYNDH